MPSGHKLTFLFILLCSVFLNMLSLDLDFGLHFYIFFIGVRFVKQAPLKKIINNGFFFYVINQEYVMGVMNMDWHVWKKKKKVIY